mmetsp:Transcript_3857/g.15396  ORF Transcript_3857/g.15396 Transcript_3857/m.15396 type:complete len:80 (+) Transcript_3857:119-358(+)
MTRTARDEFVPRGDENLRPERRRFGGGAFGARKAPRSGEETGVVARRRAPYVWDFRAPRHDVSDANSTRQVGPRSGGFL